MDLIDLYLNLFEIGQYKVWYAYTAKNQYCWN